jgi:ribosome-binding factor A
MKSYTRGDRVAGLVQEALSDVLKKSIQDPRLKSAVITGVKMSPDLKLAKIYFTVSDRVSTREDAAEGFKKAGPFIKYSLAQQLNLRYMPDLKFYYDESIDYGFHIESILKKIKNKDATGHRPTTKKQ